MEYKGYELIETKEGIVVEGVRDFESKHIFQCGQAFRWEAEKDGSYTGVAYGRVINVLYNERRLIFKNTNIEDVIKLWYDYFDLGRDYTWIKDRVAKDLVMKEAVNFGHGIRILNQEPWETLISFIISSNSNIPRIKKVIDLLASEYGEALVYEGKQYYTFPEPENILAGSLEQLDICRGGYRCKYIYNTANFIAKNMVGLDGLRELLTKEAREELKRLSGVGNKVADCVLLFSGIKQDVFPTDVWVKRVMEELYLNKEASMNEIHTFARDYFGELLGFAQQYLFYYARENRIGIK